MGCVYKLTSPSGNSYIGITRRTFADRWLDHIRMAARRRERCHAIHMAIRKYGCDAFKCIILFESDDWGLLCAYEKQAIISHRTFGNDGYNMTPGGDGVCGLSEEIKKLHRKRSSDGTRKAWRDGKMRNRSVTFSTPEFKKRHSERTSAGVIKAYTGKARENHIIAVTRESFRSKVSEQMKLRWKEPVYRANQVNKRKGRPNPLTAESRKLQGDKMKAIIAARKAAGTYWLTDRTRPN